jgi:Ca2+-binding RTX toxin-like protein
MSDVTATVYDHTFFYTSYDMHWQGVIAQTLRGALRKSVSGNEITYKDIWSGLTVTVTKSGQFVTDLVVEGPVPDGAGNTSDMVLVDASFATGALKAAKLNNVFMGYYSSSGDDYRIERLLDNFSYDVTTVSTRTVDHYNYNTIIKGGRDDDTFVFGEGPHHVVGSTGSDRYDGGPGSNSISYDEFGRGLSMTRSGVELAIQKTADDSDTLTNFHSIAGSQRGDNFKVGLGNVESYLVGLGGNDKLGGGSKADFLDGGDGKDLILGRSGNDLLVGGSGDDRIIGGAGRDVIFGSDGYGYAYGGEVNTVTGGKGRDLFVLENGSGYSSGAPMMVMTDFRNGVDLLGLIGRDFTIFEYYDAGTNFDDLTIADSDDGAVISAGINQIALLEGVDASDITRRDFVELVDYGQIATQFQFENDTYFYY